MCSFSYERFKTKSFGFLLVTLVMIINSPVSDAERNQGPDCAGVPSYGVRHLISGFAFVSFRRNAVLPLDAGL